MNKALQEFNEATEKASSKNGATLKDQFTGTIKSAWNWLTGRDIAEEQLEYQKWYDANRYQLSAEDMANAGLSKTLSAGSSPNSSVSGNSAPSNLSGVTSLLSTLSSIKGSMSNIALQKQQALKLQYENDYYATHGFFPNSEAGKYEGLKDLGKQWLTAIDKHIKPGAEPLFPNLGRLFGAGTTAGSTSDKGVVNNSTDAQNSIIDEAKNVVTGAYGKETHNGAKLNHHPDDRKTKGYDGKKKVYKYDAKNLPPYQMGGR